MAEGVAYVDVRTVEEFAEGHPTGAVNIPLMLAGPSGMVPNPDFLATMQATFAKDAAVIVGCKAGGRSQRAASALANAGFGSV